MNETPLASALRSLAWGAERSDSMSASLTPEECAAVLEYIEARENVADDRRQKIEASQAGQSPAEAHNLSTSGAAPGPATTSPFEVQHGLPTRSRTIHLSIDVRGVLSWPPSEFAKGLQWITKDDGSRFSSAEELRDAFLLELSKGRLVLPMSSDDCDDFDFKTGCRGHYDDEAEPVLCAATTTLKPEDREPVTVICELEPGHGYPHREGPYTWHDDHETNEVTCCGNGEARRETPRESSATGTF